MKHPYVQSYISNRGKAVHYYRRGTFRVRLPDDPSEPAFAKAWAAANERWQALHESPTAGVRAIQPGTVLALMGDYKASPEFLRLVPKSQRDYARMLDEVVGVLGPLRAMDVRRSHLVKLRAMVARTRGNRSADLCVAVASAMFRCGLDLDYGLERNPAHDITRLAEPESFKPWPASARHAFEESARAGACPPWLLTGYTIGLWTALRLGDVLRLSRRQWDGSGWDVRAFKTSAEGWLPAARLLREHLDEQAVAGLTYVADEAGRPIPARRFSAAFRDVLDGIGHPELHFHGLRVTTATALFEAGASDAEAGSITLHKTRAMVAHYGRKASQRRLAASAMRKLEGTP